MKDGLAVFLAFIMVLAAAAAFASSQPVGGMATAQCGRVELSAGYFYSKDKWDSNTLEGDAVFKSNLYYGQIGYGVAPGWDVYLRAGGLEAKSDGDADLKSGTKFFASAGFHGKMFEYKPWYLSFGPIGNFAYYENWTERATGEVDGIPVSGRLELKDHYSADIGFGFQWQPIKGFTFFAGPFYHWDTAKLEYSASGNGRSISDSDTIHTKQSFGPRFGINVMLGKDAWLQIEGQSRSYISGGASIGINF